MKTDRRKFIQTLGAGAAGFSIAGSVPSFAAGLNNNTAAKKAPLKMVVRADDVGYTDVCNIGAFEAVSKGLVTSMDVMMDTPGTVNALERLKDMPWISVGWHAHFWGSPVLDAAEVPSLVIEEGGRIRFRKDLRSAQDVVFDEILKECRTQMDRCVKILGRAPDTGMGGGDTPFGKAVNQICTEYGIVCGFASQQSISNGKVTLSPVSEKWADRKIFMLDAMGPTAGSRTDSVQELFKYDPFKYYLDGNARLEDFPEGSTVVMVYHPGYVDYFVFRLGDYGQAAWTTILSRVMDVEALCSERMKNWVKANNIELINHRDALYGTSEYQNHLRFIGSDMVMA